MTAPAATARPAVIATDCDGTLLDAHGRVSRRSALALLAAEEAGIEVVLVTARPPRWLDEIVADLRGLWTGQHPVAICGNGAFRYDLVAGVIVEAALLPATEVRALLHDLRRHLPQVRLATEGLQGLAREPSFERASGRIDGQWLVADLDTIGEHDAGKILVREPEADVEELLRQVQAVVGQRGEVSHSGTPGMVEIAAAGVTKGLALQRWCEERSLAAEQVWAFGDMPNDLPMLQWAGRAIAVANAHPDVLAIADEVTLAHTEDGVAHVIERALGR